ncbi:MAG TPA: pitrilysin family protein [Chthonomonadaceae bacterium]|nr:pitrilysin family protein [Chthonomonadaceae bacterium]
MTVGQRPAAPPEPFVLPNGLRVVMRERHANPLVAVDLWVRAGAREEQEGEVGCAHFLEHTLFKGTRTRGPGEADLEMENLGATLDAATGPDAAHYSATVARAHLDAALAVLADVVRNATLPDAEVERERGVILDELAQHDAAPSARLIDLLYAAAFDAHPYRRSPGGTAAAIRARSRDTLAAFYARTYAPDRCTLALAGDLTPEQARAAAQRAFGDWHAPGISKNEGSGIRAISAPEETPLRRVRIRMEMAAPRVGMAFRAPAAADAVMACAAQVIAALLGDHNAGRLSALADTDIEASARYTPRRDPSLFVLTASPSAHASGQDAAAQLAGLETALISALNGLQTAPPGPAEIATAKRAVLGRLLFETETNGGLAQAIGYADIVGGDTPEAFRARLQRLTRADILRCLQSFLNPTNRITVELVPASTTGAAR